MLNKKINIFVDGEVLVHDHFSGIGHYTASLLKAVDKLLSEPEYSDIKLCIGVEKRKAHRLHRFDFKNFETKNILIPSRIINGLKRKGWLPPIDLIFGKKTYIFPNFSSWPTIWSHSIPVIYDLSFVKYPQFGDAQNVKFLTRQVKLSVERASRIITISSNSKKEIAEHYGVKNSSIDIIFPIIDTAAFYRRSQNEIDEIKAKYCILDKKYILFVGNIEPRKNLIGLLEAYDNLPITLQKEYSLLLIGAKGWKNDAIYQKIRDMRMRGLRVLQPVDYVIDKDLPALISGASCFAYVSLYEGFGIPPVEAMACGTRVVTSNNSSLPEACGDVPIYARAEDYSSISSSIVKALNAKKYDPTKGYEQAEKFSYDTIAREFLESVINVNKK